ncbi:MAG: hypothetical protein LBR17_08180 [Bacteroidales bacterium]|jgi:hypothetical protein|nr:hypothetical protein [Bacteroidales bacterium]
MNKRILLLLTGLMFVINMEAQTEVYSMKKEGNLLQTLKKEYRSAFMMIKEGVFDTVEGVVQNEEEFDALYEKYWQFLTDMATFFKQNEFFLNEKMFMVMFFNKDGEPQYIFYNAAETSVLSDEKKEDKFKQLLKEFSKTNKINYPMRDKYSQCGTIHLEIMEDKK